MAFIPMPLDRMYALEQLEKQRDKELNQGPEIIEGYSVESASGFDLSPRKPSLKKEKRKGGIFSLFRKK